METKEHIRSLGMGVPGGINIHLDSAVPILWPLQKRQVLFGVRYLKQPQAFKIILQN